MGAPAQTVKTPKCPFAAVVAIDLQRFANRSVALVQCPDCSRTRSLSPHNGVLRFPSHDPRKMLTPVAAKRWAKGKKSGWWSAVKAPEACAGEPLGLACKWSAGGTSWDAGSGRAKPERKEGRNGSGMLFPGATSLVAREVVGTSKASHNAQFLKR